MHFPDIRKAALIACVASVLSLFIPLWNMMNSIIRIESANSSSNWWLAPMLMVAYPLAAVMPMFYFALYRNEGTLHFSERLRFICRAAAFIFGAISAVELLRWIRSQGAFWTAVRMVDWSKGGANGLAAFRELRRIRGVSTLFEELGNFAVILVLIAFFRQVPNGESSVSGLLKFAAKVTTVAGGIWLAFLLIRIVVTPYSYSQLGRTPPPFWEMMGTFLAQACLFTAPYVVYKGPARAD